MRQLALHLVFVSVILLAPAAEAAEPLRLPDGEPLVCIYYFTHWWEPWKSDDNAILSDFRRLRAMVKRYRELAGPR
jgi:hypothetical protein